MAAIDLTDLDDAFTLPDVVTDPRLRALYEVLVHRLRAEAAYMPMNTIQQLLIERICYNYVVLRAKEAGELGGFGNTNVQKDFNSFWLSMTAEFNRMLGKGGEPLSGLERKSLLKDVQQIIVTTLATVPDPKIRSDLLVKLASAFEHAGI